MTLLELLSELLGEAWWLSRTAQRLRFWGAVIAITLFLLAWLAGVYDTAPQTDPLTPHADPHIGFLLGWWST